MRYQKEWIGPEPRTTSQDTTIAFDSKAYELARYYIEVDGLKHFGDLPRTERDALIRRLAMEIHKAATVFCEWEAIAARVARVSDSLSRNL